MVSFLSVGHQNLFCRSWIVVLIPGWPELRAVWTWSMVRLRSVSGTNSLSWGHSGGMTCSLLAWSISVMISHWMGDMMIVGEITFSGWVGSEPISNCRDSASALMFLVPGRYVTVKTKQEKNSDHLACLGLSLRAVLRYSKLRWSVHTVKGWFAPSNQWRHSSRADLMARSSRSPRHNSVLWRLVSVNSRHRGTT